MGDLVNLRLVKKRRVKAEAAADAVVQRALFGRTKGEKQADLDAKDRARRVLDQARLDPSRPDPSRVSD